MVADVATIAAIGSGLTGGALFIEVMMGGTAAAQVLGVSIQ